MEVAHLSTTNWVCNLTDYVAMYDLSKSDLQKSIVDFPAGISSVNVEANAEGAHIISVDPFYNLTPEKMFIHAEAILQENIAYLNKTKGRLKEETMLDHVIHLWKNSERNFLADYEKGKSEKRYQYAALPKLPFSFHQFELALCTDFLFHHALSSDDIVRVFQALSHVALEVRFYPLLNHSGKMTDELGPFLLWLQKNNFGTEVRQVPYEIQKGGNAMLRVWSQECHL
ncbi:MAG: putative cytosolic protein [uncultured bacterium]|nr:MAG: putative cytosolic protein [uncultured bacterium]